MKKLLTVLVAGLIVSGILTGCIPKTTETRDTNQEELMDQQVDVAYPLKVRDQLGREIEIKEQPKRIISSYYITSSLLIALEAEDRVVGLEMKADKRGIYKLAAPNFLDLPAVGNSKTLSIEACVALEPDLMLIPTRLSGFIPQLEALQIPVLVVEPESMEAFLECVELIGRVIGKEARAKELIQYHMKVMEEVKALTKDVEERPTVYLAGSSNPLETCTSQMYQNSLIEMAGGKNVSGELMEPYWTTVSPETLLLWNPSHLFAVSYAGYNLTAFTENAKYKGIDGVEKGNVYTFPSALEAWDYPTPSSALGILWLVHKLHPSLYSEEAYREQVQGFYDYFYAIDVEEVLGL